MSTETAVRNPYQERHAFRADIQAARVAADTLRGKLAQLATEQKQAEADAFKHEMELVVGTEGAAEQRDAAVERARRAASVEVEYRRGLKAAEEIMAVREAQLKQLYDSEEGFAAFCKEAESATAGAIRDLQELRGLLSTASQSWAKASAFWRPLNGSLRRRLEELNAAEGQYPNTAPQAAVQPFPLSLPSDLATAAPRPAGIDRLHNAQRGKQQHRTDPAAPVMRKESFVTCSKEGASTAAVSYKCGTAAQVFTNVRGGPFGGAPCGAPSSA